VSSAITHFRPVHGGWDTSTTAGPLSLHSYNPTVEVAIAHSEDGPFEADIIEKRVIPASTSPTPVVLRSRVSAQRATSVPSAGYTAVLRRRSVQSVLKALNDLSSKIDRPDISACTLPVVESVRDAIRSIQDADSEGNSREVLRQLRDTFLNGGWEQYRNAGAVDAARRVVQLLLGDDVPASHPDESYKILTTAGLTPLSVPLFEYSDEEDAGAE
jgi:hypothetical protein